MAQGGTFISMCQLVPLSIMVMLKDIVFWAERGGKMENGGGSGGGDEGGSTCPLFIVNGLAVTLTRCI